MNLVCLYLGFQSLRPSDCVTRDEFAALFLRQENDGEQVWFWATKPERPLLYTIRTETYLAETLTVARKPAEKRPPPFTWGQSP
jgi:hypothetical protein